MFCLHDRTHECHAECRLFMLMFCMHCYLHEVHSLPIVHAHVLSAVLAAQSMLSICHARSYCACTIACIRVTRRACDWTAMQCPRQNGAASCTAHYELASMQRNGMCSRSCTHSLRMARMKAPQRLMLVPLSLLRCTRLYPITTSKNGSTRGKGRGHTACASSSPCCRTLRKGGCARPPT